MFDPYAQEVIAAASTVENIDSAEIRRTLSSSYFWLVSRRLSLQEEDVPSRDRAATIAALRRLANTMECAAVFDPLRGVNRTADEVRGAAFVGAEALALLADLVTPAEGVKAEQNHILADSKIIARVEAGLMYMIGGFDINAVAVIQPAMSVLDIDPPNRTPLQVSSYRLARRIADFLTGHAAYSSIPEVSLPAPVDNEVYEALVERLRIALFDRLLRALAQHLAWLAGAEDRLRTEAVETLEVTREAVQLGRVHTGHVCGEFGDVYHLAGLLLGAFKATAGRSLVAKVPHPRGPYITEEAYGAYLRGRASTRETMAGRPLLWPSAIEYVEACLPGPYRDAVVTFPTGSGKGFVAELAISHALAQGSVLYLAPTNALCHQVRRDLFNSVGRAFNVPVSAFVGGQEYTTLASEQVTATSEEFIAVMTPEKCALAVRVTRETFSRFSLCVVDECHLLNDDQRGPTLEILIADLLGLVPEIRFLLMSAMIANPEDLVGWLDSLRPGSVVPCGVKWRPSRTARSFVFIDKDQQKKEVAAAREELRADTSTRARTIDFSLDLGWMVGLSGAWQADGPEDYIIARLSAAAQGFASRNRRGVESTSIPSWKNTTGRLVAERLAEASIPTINFILSSRHHAFGQASRAVGTPPSPGNPILPPIVEAWLHIAESELGLPTVLRDLLAKGVAVHTSAMLSVEQAAAAMAFSKKLVNLMFATGTLAQGLNLPATAVVVSGSSLGDPREMDRQAGLTRVNEIILNAFGRAGRPGFSNQAIVVLVSDKPFRAPVVADIDPQDVLRAYPVLQQPDASVTLSSKLDHLLDRLQAQGSDPELLDLEVFGTLVGREDQAVRAGRLLGSTYGGYLRRKAGSTVNESAIDLTVAQERSRILDRPGTPPWLGQAAMRAGASLNHTLYIWQAYLEIGIKNGSTEWGVSGWYRMFLDVMKRLPPAQVQGYFAPPDQKTETVRTRLRDLASMAGTPGWRDQWSGTWDALGKIVWQYMKGDSYRSMAGALLAKHGDLIDNKRTSGAQPIPGMFKFLREVVGFGLALDAGCFVAVYEAATIQPGVVVPEALAALPLCIRNGCDSLDTLAWFRFGMRERICAHELARVFPLPEEAIEDRVRAQWGRDTRKSWLASSERSDSDVLAAARTIIMSGEGF